MSTEIVLRIDGEEFALSLDKLRLLPEDLLVLSSERHLPLVAYESLRDSIRLVVPEGVKIIVLDGGMRLEKREAI